MKTIKITISPIGKPKVEADGFAGVGCAAATAGIEKALAGGTGTVTREIKPEWNEIEGATESEGLKMSW